MFVDYAFFYSSPTLLCIPLLFTLCFLFLSSIMLYPFTSLSLSLLSSLSEIGPSGHFDLSWPISLLWCAFHPKVYFQGAMGWLDWKNSPSVKRTASLCHSPSVLPLSPAAGLHTLTHTQYSVQNSGSVSYSRETLALVGQLLLYMEMWCNFCSDTC